MAKTRKIKRVERKIETLTLLPKKLNKEIDSLGLSNYLRDKAKVFVSVLLRKAEYDNGFVYLSTSYITKHISSRYNLFINALLEQGIVEKTHYYSIKNNICYGYRVNFEFLGDGAPVIVRTGYVKDSEDTLQCNVYEMFKKDIKSLRIDVGRLERAVGEYVRGITKESILVNNQVTDQIVFMKKHGETYFLSLERALEIAKEDGVDLIKDGRNFYFDDVECYLDKKKKVCFYSHMSSIKNLHKRILFAKRNTTNTRLDSNITNMPSYLVDLIKKDNDLVEIDMNNSQMVFLADCINSDKEDLKLFKTLSHSGELYPYILRELGLKSKLDAKLRTFEVLFSSEKHNSTQTKEFFSLFPSLKEEINEMKRNMGHKNFAILLQKKEAELFIDGFYTKIKKKKMFCLTKHDSLIVKKSDLSVVMDLCCEEMTKRGFECTLKVS